MKKSFFLSIALLASMLTPALTHAEGRKVSPEEQVENMVVTARDRICPDKHNQLICIVDFNSALGSLRTILRLQRSRRHMLEIGDLQRAQAMERYTNEEFVEMNRTLAELKGKYIGP
jgi:hypothetical protein